MPQKRTSAIEKKLSQLEDVKVFFEEMREKKREAFDKKSDKYQESEKGQAMDEFINELESVVEDLDTAYNKFADELFPDDYEEED